MTEDKRRDRMVRYLRLLSDEQIKNGVARVEECGNLVTPSYTYDVIVKRGCNYDMIELEICDVVNKMEKKDGGFCKYYNKTSNFIFKEREHSNIFNACTKNAIEDIY